jgi:WXG100 family type VII secretion target
VSQLVVALDLLRAAIGHMDRFGREVDDVLDDVEQTMVVLRDTWHGDGSDAQAAAAQKWRDGAEQMQAALAALRGAADIARQNYTDALQTNGQMWQA